MGLGKTLQAIAAAQFLPGRILVVCPASARSVWKQEVQAWTRERSRVLTPADDAEAFLKADAGEKYVVVAYSGLAKFGDALGKLAFDLVILDESHYVKSRQAQRTRLVEEKLRRIPRRLILSGTPVMNEPKEIRTQLAFVHPDEWSDTAWFNRRFQTPWKNGTPEVKEAVLARLRDYLEGVMLRREKRQALPDLPEKHLRVTRLQLPPEMRRAYDDQEDQFSDYVQEHEDTALTGGMATTAGRLERLKQTALVGKLPLIVSAVKGMLDKGEKVVVFCHYREPIRSLAQELAPYGVVTLTGSTESDERGESVRRFQEDPEVRVFIGQTVAAGVAVTLTAARHAVFCDLEWNPALHRQAMDRIHRKTQTRDVEVHFFLAEDTIEEDVAEVLEEKTQMMDQLLEGRAGSGFGLRDKEAAQREVALRILSRKRKRMAGVEEEPDED
jgi:SWI/SNF-related matrix-associated actin-dependent regulator of chromatin subfamily A-like protein 1